MKMFRVFVLLFSSAMISSVQSRAAQGEDTGPSDVAPDSVEVDPNANLRLPRVAPRLNSKLGLIFKTFYGCASCTK